ncbi:hypothetical protein MMC28_005839 [Mycoblastus sanguinarius]|nr:hypothetical protein [Mycoblastus sanguinarius]
MYSDLETLALGLATYRGETKTHEIYDSLSGLQTLLNSMARLEILDISFGHYNWLFYDQGFPKNGQWTSLTKLSLFYLEINVKDLVHLFTVAMPNLRNLMLEWIYLRGGRWEGMIEFMRTAMNLSSFGPCLHNQGLFHLGYQVFADCRNEPFLQMLEDYVVNGGRHPCLLPDEPASASQRFLSELEL